MSRARVLPAALLFCSFAPITLADDAAERTALSREIESVLASPLALAPFSVPRASFFHAALDVPPLESAKTLAPGSLYLRLRSTHARSEKEETLAGIPNRFEGIYHEWIALDASWGIAGGWEAGLWLPIAGWDETQDRFFLFDDAGNAIVRDEEGVITGTEASRRHDNGSVLGLRVKRVLIDHAKFDLSASAQLKIPIGRPRDLTNAGTWDAAFTLLATVPEPWGALHANLGATFPIGNQNIFVPEQDVTLDPIVHGGIAATFPVGTRLTLGVQIEANSSAFGDVEFLQGPPVEVVAGARWIKGRWVFEIGGGTGLDWDTSYQWLGFLSFGRVF